MLASWKPSQQAEQGLAAHATCRGANIEKRREWSRADLPGTNPNTLSIIGGRTSIGGLGPSKKQPFTGTKKTFIPSDCQILSALA